MLHVDIQEGMKTRNQALNLALDDLMDWLRESMDPPSACASLRSMHVCSFNMTHMLQCAGEDHQVAIFDATNSTLDRRRYLIDRFHNKVQYMFIESICNDEETLIKNMELKLKYSPDYENMSTEEVGTSTS